MTTEHVAFQHADPCECQEDLGGERLAGACERLWRASNTLVAISVTFAETYRRTLLVAVPKDATAEEIGALAEDAANEAPWPTGMDAEFIDRGTVHINTQRTPMTLTELLEYCNRHGLVPDDLDEEIHRAKVEEARALSNEGLDAQLRYLLATKLSPIELFEVLKDLAEHPA